MHDQPSQAPPATDPAEQDRCAQHAVLALLVHAHPGQYALEELLRKLAGDPDDFAARDAVANAVRDLVGAGLVHRHNRFVFATRAAVRFDALEI